MVPFNISVNPSVGPMSRRFLELAARSGIRRRRFTLVFRCLVLVLRESSSSRIDRQCTRGRQPDAHVAIHAESAGWPCARRCWLCAPPSRIASRTRGRGSRALHPGGIKPSGRNRAFMTAIPGGALAAVIGKIHRQGEMRPVLALPADTMVTPPPSPFSLRLVCVVSPRCVVRRQAAEARAPTAARSSSRAEVDRGPLGPGRPARRLAPRGRHLVSLSIADSGSVTYCPRRLH